MVSSAGFSPDGQRVVVGERSGTARIWNLSPAPQPLSEILLLTQAQTSRRIDPRTGGSTTVSVEQLERGWRTLTAHHAGELAPSRAQTLGWHRQEVEACAALGQWPLVLEHLKPLIEASPNDPTLHA